MKTTFAWRGLLKVIFTVLLVVGGSLLVTAGNRIEGKAEEGGQTSTNSLHPVETFRADSRATTIIDAFRQVNVAYYPEDKVSTFPDPALGLGTVVTVERALPITVYDGKRQYVYRTWQTTVGELLEEKKIVLGNEDRIAPSMETKLDRGMRVTITRVERTTITEKETIPYQTMIEKDYYSFVGNRTVLTAGKNGERENTFLLIREDGELLSKTLTSTVVTISPQTARIRQGALNPVPSHCLQYKHWVVEASLKNRIDPNALYYRMVRESNCNRSSIGYGPNNKIYEGLFQYEAGGLWQNLSTKAGFGGSSVWDARAQIYTTAWAWANGHRSRWPTP